jgi:hypothetical protein
MCLITNNLNRKNVFIGVNDSLLLDYVIRTDYIFKVLKNNIYKICFT